MVGYPRIYSVIVPPYFPQKNDGPAPPNGRPKLVPPNGPNRFNRLNRYRELLPGSAGASGVKRVAIVSAAQQLPLKVSQQICRAVAFFSANSRIS
jgi:hypothetical protein